MMLRDGWFIEGFSRDWLLQNINIILPVENWQKGLYLVRADREARLLVKELVVQ